MPPQLQSPQSAPDPRAELERLRKVKRLRELEAKAAGQQPAQPSFLERQGQRMVSMSTPQADNVPVPVGQAQSAASGMFADEQAKAERYKAELAAMNAASPIPFKNTGPGGPLELNQERPDLLGMRAVASGINTNIGAANAAIDTGARVGMALGAAPDPNIQGALAGMEYYRGEGDAPERLASAVDQGGYLEQMQKLDRQGDALPSLPIPQAQTAGEVGADIVGQLGGYIFGPGKFVNKPGQNIGAVAGAPRIRGAITREAIENAGHAYAFGASTAEPGSDRNLAGLETATNPLSYVSIEALRAAPRAFKALDNALTRPAQLTPTNAGGASQPRPQPSVAPPVAPVAQAPIPQGPPRMAQAGPAGAGQQPPAGGPKPVLNTVRTAPTISKAQAREAKDTAVILGRILRAGGIKNDAIRGYLPGLIQRYESLGNSRIPLARFIERDLPQHFPEGVAGDVVTKLRGFGRERHASTGPKDSSRYTVQDTVKSLRGSQQDHLTEVIRSNTYRKDLIDAEDKIKADMRKNAEAGYETALANGLERFTQNRAAPDEVAAFEQMRTLIASEPFLSRVPDHVKVRAIREGKPLEEAIAADPVRTAHWLQSALGKAERAAQGMGGKATPESLLYSELREAVLDPLQKAVPGYKGARSAHGDLFGADEALEFGEDLFLAARSEVETARKARDFGKLSKQQQTVATMSIRDKLLNEFRGTPEDAAAKLTRMQQEGVLDAIERILGADGKRITAAIRETVEENDWLRSIDQGSGSPTFANAAGARDAAENVRGPINKAVGSLGDKRTYLGAVVGDVVLSSVGVPPVLTVGKATSDVVGAAGRPSARQLSNASKGLFGLPEPKAPAPPPTRAPRGPRKPKAPEQLEADLETLLKRYDQIDHRNNPTESARVLKQIDALKKRLAKPPATTAPRRNGGNGTVSRIVAGGVVGGMAGTFAGEADAQSTETTAQLDAVNERIKQLEADAKIFETGSILQIQQLLQRRGKVIADDGKMGPQTAAAIQKDRDETRAELENARARRKELEKQAANEATRPNDAQMALREWGPILGALAGLGLGTKLRSGAVNKAAKTAPAQIAKANALLTPGPLNKSRNAAAQAALKKQPANLNEFWQLGGAKDAVPFDVGAGGKWKPRKKSEVMPPSKLYPNRRIRSMDVGVMAGGVAEGVGAQVAASALEGQIEEARALAEKEPTRANLARVEALEDQHAIAVLMSRLGYGVAGGRLIASLKIPYKDARPDVAAADAERALLLEYLKKVK